MHKKAGQIATAGSVRARADTTDAAFRHGRRAHRRWPSGADCGISWSDMRDSSPRSGRSQTRLVFGRIADHGEVGEPFGAGSRIELLPYLAAVGEQ